MTRLPVVDLCSDLTDEGTPSERHPKRLRKDSDKAVSVHIVRLALVLQLVSPGSGAGWKLGVATSGMPLEAWVRRQVP